MSLFNIPNRYKVLFEKVEQGKASPRKAIKAKCLSCVGFENMREEISKCTVKECPLFHHRPYKEEKHEK